jgi:LacI family transcriptional regulator
MLAFNNSPFMYITMRIYKPFFIRPFFLQERFQTTILLLLNLTSFKKNAYICGVFAHTPVTVLKNMSDYRIKDLAVMAGVSAGTVDRVLHKRGKVSAEALDKVEKVLQEINYQPNVIARSLASKKNCRILTLIPAFMPGEYWSKISEGINKAAQEFANFHIEIQYIYFNQYDQTSFDSTLKNIKQIDCHGIIIAPLFKRSTLTLTAWLDKKEIPYVLIDAYLEDTNCIAFYGTDSYRSGVLGGRLLFEQIQRNDNLFVFNIIRKRTSQSIQVSKREEGFRDYLSSVNYEGKIYSIPIQPKAPKTYEQMLDVFLRKRNPIRAGIIFNSRVHLIANYFRKHKINDFFLIGYDTIETNIPFLKNGTVSHLIAQRPEVQGYNSVKALFQHLLLKQPVQKINYMPIDILMKENIDYYNNYI